MSMKGISGFRYFRRCLESSRKFSSQVSAAENFEPRLEKTTKHLELDEPVTDALNRGVYKPKHHPGILPRGIVDPPAGFVHAMEVVTAGCKKSDLVKKGEALRNRLWGRRLPPEEKEYIKEIKRERKRAQSAISEISNDIDLNSVGKLEEELVTQRLHHIMHPWHPLPVSEETCQEYLVSRSPAELSVLYKIFTEIRIRDPDFDPTTFCDFGSGVASGYWAMKQVWQKPLKEAYNVDSNIHMNELASKLLEISNQPFTAQSGVFFRQFLPVSCERGYDMVLSAFTLLELPSFKERMETLSLLWSKTDKYLVLVEDGTKAGYQAVMEARNLIIHLQTSDGEGDPGFHVFAPCPHDLQCPLFKPDGHPCNYEALYWTPKFLENRQKERSHLFTYLVLKKAPRPGSDPQWPRCVGPTKRRSKEVILQLCMSNGQLENAAFLKQYQCRNAYQCAKRSQWGDRIPVKIAEIKKGDIMEKLKQDKAHTKT